MKMETGPSLGRDRSSVSYDVEPDKSFKVILLSSSFFQDLHSDPLRASLRRRCSQA
jgi:hypothetical protein